MVDVHTAGGVIPGGAEIVARGHDHRLRSTVGCTSETFEMRAGNEMVHTTSPFEEHHGLCVPSVRPKS